MNPSDVFQVRRSTLPDQVAAGLRRMIVSGAIAVGSALPSEQELSHMFGCGRGVVREALRGLEELGLLARTVNGREMIVQPLDTDKISSTLQLYMQLSAVTFDELFQFLEGLEPWTARQASTRGDAVVVARLRALHATPITDLTSLVEVEESFHDLLAEASGNRLLILARKPVRAALHDAIVSIVPMMATGAISGTLRAHDEMLRAIETHDGSRAADWSYRHARALRHGLETIGKSGTDPVYPLASHA